MSRSKAQAAVAVPSGLITSASESIGWVDEPVARSTAGPQLLLLAVKRRACSDSFVESSQITTTLPAASTAATGLAESTPAVEIVVAAPKPPPGARRDTWMRNLEPSDRAQASAPNPEELTERLGVSAFWPASERSTAALQGAPGAWPAICTRSFVPSLRIQAAKVSPIPSDATCEKPGEPAVGAFERLTGASQVGAAAAGSAAVSVSPSASTDVRKTPPIGPA